MNRRTLLVIGIATFAVLFTFSLVFYKERVAFMDLSFHLFCLLKDKDFAIQNFRFGAFFTQLFPLVGDKLDWTLPSITKLYSISFISLYFSVFLILLKGFKNEKLALVYLLSCVLMTRHTFFWAQSELPQAMAFGFIYMALLHQYLQSTKLGWLRASMLILTLITAVFTHPLMIFFFLFSLFYTFILYPLEKKKVFVQTLFVFLITVVKNVYFKTSYDLSAMSSIKNGLNLFLQNPKLLSHKNYVHYFLFDYWLVTLIFITVLIWSLKNRKYYFFFFFSLFFLGYSFIVNLSEAYGAHQFYIENKYLPLVVFVTFPLVYQIFPLMNNKKILTTVTILMIGFSLFGIYEIQPMYLKRVNWYRTLLSSTAQLKQNKLIVPKSKAPEEILLMFWASSYEVWLLSTLETGVSRSVIIEEHEHEFPEATSKTNDFQAKWGIFPYSTFDKKYFNFIDSTTAYVAY